MDVWEEARSGAAALVAHYERWWRRWRIETDEQRISRMVLENTRRSYRRRLRLVPSLKNTPIKTYSKVADDGIV